MAWKAIHFSGLDSVDRLHRLQALCSSENGQGADAILIVGGVDGYHSQVCQAVLKYLFLGASGQELLGEQVISQQQERLEDIVLLLRRRSVSIFYSSESEAAVTILPAISKWRQVTEYVVHDGMDLDDQETRKICAFRNMVAGVSCIGVPFGTDPQGKNLQDTMLPEKWPLIQSYGLEEDGPHSKGFFTMNHRVVNVSSQLMSAMHQMDAFTARRIVQESEPLLSHHFDEFLRKLDHAESADIRSKRSETEVVEDLLSFYEFGTTQYAARGLEVPPTRGSKVLYGNRSSSLQLKSSTTANLATAGPSAEVPATHMLVQAEDPFSGARLARTYFMSTGKICKRVVDADALVQQLGEEGTTSAGNMMDTRFLIALYSALLRGFAAGRRILVQEIGGCASLEQCSTIVKDFAVKNMTNIELACEDPGVASALKRAMDLLDERLHVTLDVLDACGRSFASQSSIQGNDWCFVYFALEVAGIQSVSSPNAGSLGSLIVGDSMLIQLPSKAHASSVSTAANGLCLTKNFPYFRSWSQSGVEADAKDSFDATLQSEFMLQAPAMQLGKMIPSLDMDSAGITSDNSQGIKRSQSQPSVSEVHNAILLLDVVDVPLVIGSMRFFTGGFVFKSPHFNPILVSIAKHVESFQFVPSEYEELLLLTVLFKQGEQKSFTPVSEALPFSDPCARLHIPLIAGTRYQAEVLHALTSWKETANALNVPIYRPHDLDVQSVDAITPRDTDTKRVELSQAIKDACEMLATKHRFVGSDSVQLQRFFPPEFIPKDSTLNISLPRLSESNLRKMVVPVTVMVGVPGSGVSALSRSLCDISSSDFEWQEVHIDMRTLSKSKAAMEACLYSEVGAKMCQALEQIKEHVDTVRLHPRIMLSVTGYVDPITIVRGIQHTAAAKAPLPVKVSAVIACVSATCVYKPDTSSSEAPFPKLMDQLAAGFATHIVLTNTAELATEQLQRLRYRIDLANPFADVQVLAFDIFEGPITTLLVVDRFNGAYYTSYRQVHYPNWDSDSITEPVWSHVAELDAEQTPDSWRFRLAPGVERAKFFQLAVRALTPFATLTKSLEKIHPVTKSETGIRLAQSIAAGKTQKDSNTGVADDLFLDKTCGSAWCVEGRVVFAGDTACTYDFVSTGSFARLREAHPQQSSQRTEQLSLTVTGKGINPEKLHHLLLHCFSLVERAKQEIRTAISVTLEEKRELQKEHAMDPLPDGYMFDGVNYVDFYGGRFEFHPNMPQIIEDHVAAVNAAVKTANLTAENAQKDEELYVQPIV